MGYGRRMDKTCSKCGETKALVMFYTVRSRHGKLYPRNECKACTHQTNYAYKKARPKVVSDVSYDYRFAVMLGMDHDQAIQWLEKGYPDVTKFQIAQMGLYSSFGTAWIPDEEMADV